LIIDRSTDLDKLATALHMAQAKLKVASKDAVNPHLKSKYADLGSIWDASREALGEAGLSVSQHPGSDGALVTLDTVLLHTSGQFIHSRASAPLAQASAQGVGSCVSYLRRYALAAVVGVVSDVLDDDGAAAAPRQAVDHQARSQPVQQAAARVEKTFPGARTVAVDGIEPACDKCGGAMWDNRKRKADGQMNPKGPDFACKDKTCDGRIWKFNPQPAGPVPQSDAPMFSDEETPF
jgi:hypothetical protein